MILIRVKRSYIIDIDADDALQAVDKMRRLRQLIMKGVGIPVSIGIAHTRTLAKVANHYAKAYSNYRGVCSIDSEEKRVKALKLFPVDEVWGVGRRNMKVMQYNGIRTAYGFTQMSEAWVKANFQLQGVRTWKELRGVACKDLTDMSEKKSICVSRSFGSMISDYSQMAESVANFASSCAEKLRRQHSVASCITVFIHTNSHREDLAVRQHTYRLHACAYFLYRRNRHLCTRCAQTHFSPRIHV